jgi:hypothetical protein
VGHYLELVSVHLEAALELCQAGRPVERGVLEWLLSQGEFATRALAEGGGANEPLERTRLLELLLCLANLHEYARHHSVDAAPAARVASAFEAP